MDNEDLTLLPHEEQLVRLLEMTNRYGVALAASMGRPLTASQEHLNETGHLLAFGCCRPSEWPPARV